MGSLKHWKEQEWGAWHVDEFDELGVDVFLGRVFGCFLGGGSVGLGASGALWQGCGSLLLAGVEICDAADGTGADGAEVFDFVYFHAALLCWAVAAFGLVASSFKDSDDLGASVE